MTAGCSAVIRVFGFAFCPVRFPGVRRLPPCRRQVAEHSATLPIPDFSPDVRHPSLRETLFMPGRQRRGSVAEILFAGAESKSDSRPRESFFTQAQSAEAIRGRRSPM